MEAEAIYIWSLTVYWVPIMWLILKTYLLNKRSLKKLMIQQFEMEFKVHVPFPQLARALILGKSFHSLSLSVTICKMGITFS